MAISVIQTAAASDPSTGTNTNTLSVTINGVTAGNILHVFAEGNGWGGNGLQLAISDSRNDTFIQLSSAIENARRANDWYLPSAPGGSITITIAYSMNSTLKGVAVKEIGGSSGYQGLHASQAQSNPGTGANAISSGNMTPTAQPALVSSFSVNTGVGFGTTVSPTIGTGYTQDAVGWTWGTATNAMCAESQRITSLSAIAGTYTASGATGGNDRFKTVAAIFTEGSNPVGITVNYVGA